ncbi:Uncharacterised protein [Vibrio parahaemolyticus]|nr:Uncharacterised protein [Vibrio parahaemolyticus]
MLLTQPTEVQIGVHFGVHRDKYREKTLDLYIIIGKLRAVS